MTKKRFSKYKNILLLLIDLIILITLTFTVIKNCDLLTLNIWNIFTWTLTALWIRFYKIGRNTKTYKILSNITRQLIVFTLTFFTFFTFFEHSIYDYDGVEFICLFFTIIFTRVLLTAYLLKAYRLQGYNYRNIIIVGDNNSSKKIINYFDSNKESGYIFKGYFSNNPIKKIGNISDLEKFLNNPLNQIDEVFINASTLSEIELKRTIKFIEEIFLPIRIIPDEKMKFISSLELSYLGYNPILLKSSLKINEHFLKLIKRIFDFIFSFIILIPFTLFILPLFAYLIKRENSGPVFFKQQRVGAKGKLFWCYKFRSMYINKGLNQKQVTKNDPRITKIGAFMRKTSIDELPQFMNVLLGEMSVVGPRPHMISYDDLFSKKHKRYLFRHNVKPGITGLAQTKGFRGEIESDHDIRSRTKLDIFYIENWTLLMDIIIIFNTILNIFKGEEKAY